MNHLAQRQAEMRERYLPSVERDIRRRGRPCKAQTIVAPAPKRKHFSEECQVGWHYLNCPDLNCDCTCHNDEYKGETAQ